MALALADDVGFYTEWFAILPEESSDVDAEHYLNGGFTWQPNDDIQWDARVGTGLNAPPPTSSVASASRSGSANVGQAGSLSHGHY